MEDEVVREIADLLDKLQLNELDSKWVQEVSETAEEA
jgi:hypothetical protein